MRKLIWIILITILLSSCATLKPHPREWTKGEKTAAGFFIGAHILNCISTEAMLDNPRNYEKLNLGLGKHPSDKKIVGYFSLTGLGALVLSHFWPELRHSLLWPYGGVNLLMYNYDRRLD